ncbi:SAM-dependent methyltransferase [Micromonospora sp. NPDC050397]|uniref:SAM-dependent methyltransferase n=1 Tax=Micromonospora sp. NPDC050397 TaxID=3364279 RepID=UPI0038502162
MTDDVQPLERLALAGKARQSLKNWIAGAQFLALLAAIDEQGWTRFLAEPRDLDALTDFSGLPPARLRDLVDALEAHGVVERQDRTVRLSAPFEALAADDAMIGLSDLLAGATLMAGKIRAAAQSPGALPLTDDDALVVARAVGGRVTPVSRTLYENLFTGGLPELAGAVRAGRWLDVGCGIAGATLTMATMVPQLRAVAVELVPLVAAEATRRTEALDLTDRVEVRCVDARDVDEKDTFAGAFWAQPFFPESARTATLDMILRALEPGGLLFVQEMEPEPQESDRPAYALRRLVYQGWGVPFGRTAEQLAAEAESAGFALVRIAPTDFGRFVILRRPVE